jgi:S-DNA-T family DNA segregation ATPase FtsK/SpoIIIE
MSDEGSGLVVFHRPARVFPDPVDAKPIWISAPPTVPEPNRGTVLQMLLPVVGSLSLVGFAFIFRHDNPAFLWVAGAIAGLMLLVMVAIRIQQGRSAKKRRARNIRKYREYLDEQRERLKAVAEAQHAAADRLYPEAEELWTLASTRRCLWERRREDDDFMHVRIGVGEVPLAAPVEMDLGSDPLVEREPDCLVRAEELVASYRTLDLLPVSIPADEVGCLAVVGDPEATRGLVRSMLCGLVTWHSPEDLRLVAWFEPPAEPDWGWLKWLPHTRDTAGFAGDESQRHAVGLTVEPSDLDVLLTQLIRPRFEHLDRVRESGLRNETVSFQQAVVVIDGYTPSSAVGRLPVFDELLARAHEIGVLVIAIVEDADDIPTKIGARIDLAEGGWASYVESGPDGRRINRIRADGASLDVCDGIARAMAPLRLRVRGGRTTSVDTEGLLDLLGLPSATAIEPERLWQHPDREELLRTPIGVGEDGSPIVLDVKEAAEGGMGPHGLIVGATGSGKSELLRTLVTGLAVRHSPEDLAFVLVDYKGGATFSEAAQLPHVAGMITNLERDLTLVDRMHDALFGELERRQRILQDAGNFDRARDYQIFRAEHPENDLPPLPSLLLIIDEFGELLTSRPDFLDLFVSIGRTGRSLGVHLLLATQRLDEGRIRGLEGHLRYRICLRTFSGEESLVALGTRAAFELPPLPGLGYLKVDNAMQRFKGALATRPYREHRAFVDEPTVVRTFTATGPGAEVAVVDADGRVRGEGSAEELLLARGSDPEPGRVRTEMQIAVDALSTADAFDGRVRQVWLPPLPSAFALNSIVDASDRDFEVGEHRPGSAGWLRVPVGLLDRPRHQVQVPFWADFKGIGGHLAIVGAPRSGKSTLLQTLIAGLALTHDPSDVQVYAIDFGGGGLHALAGAPHVGAVHGRGDRDAIERVVRELRGIVRERSSLFRRHGLDGMAAYHRARRDGVVANSGYGEVFLIIDNWGLLTQEFALEFQDEMADLISGGLHFGVHVIVSANRWNDIRMQVRDNVGGRLELRLNDPIESEIDRHAARAVPEDTPGRGITRAGDHFQAALPRVDGRDDVGGLGLGIEGLLERVAERWAKSAGAPPVRMLPAEVHLSNLSESGRSSGVPIGLGEFGLEPVHVDLFGRDPHFLIFGDSECGKTTLIRTLIGGLTDRHGPDELQIALVDYRRQLVGLVPNEQAFGYACTPEMTGDLSARLSAEIAGRLPAADASPEALSVRRWWTGPEIVLAIDDYDLVAGAAGNPLASLVELVAQGRDVGFHVILARRVGGTARSAFEAFLQRVRELGSPGLVMSGDPQEGPIIGERKAESLPPGRGYLVRRRHSMLVQTAMDSAPVAISVDDALDATKNKTRG